MILYFDNGVHLQFVFSIAGAGNSRERAVANHVIARTCLKTTVTLFEKPANYIISKTTIFTDRNAHDEKKHQILDWGRSFLRKTKLQFGRRGVTSFSLKDRITATPLITSKSVSSCHMRTISNTQCYGNSCSIESEPICCQLTTAEVSVHVVWAREV